MASDQYQELVRLSPFKGIDATTADEIVEKDRGVFASNANPSRTTGALMCERGRINIADFAAYMQAITTVFTCIGELDSVYYIVQGTTAGGGVATLMYNPGLGSTLPLTGAYAFDQAVQYASVVYTNAGQRFFMSNFPQTTQFYDWQYQPPVAAGNLTLAATGGSMLAATYYYVITRTTTMPDGSISETSVDLNQYANPPQIVLSATGGVTITPSNGLQFAGTNDDGTTFTTNLYRQSTLQPTYLLVTNLTTNGPYTDTTPDSTIVNNVQLTVHRDAPPVSKTNRGALVCHKTRVWCFVTVTDANTNNLPQVQLWYSNVDRVWEFDLTSQVLLLESDVASNPGTGTTNYESLYGNEPKALVSIGTILLAFKKRETWSIYGDDATTFIQRNVFNIGAVSRHSVTPVVGGCFWLSENGAYYFDGSSPAYDSERIRNLIRATPGVPDLTIPNTAIAPSDQVKAVGSFSNLTWYLSFPTLGITYGYNTVSGEWMSQLPYAPATAGGLCSVPSHPNRFGGTELNEVVASRSSKPTSLDWWFCDQSYDLGQPQTCTWYGAISTAPKTSYEKQYRYLTLIGPIQQGSAVVTLTVDPGISPPKQVVWTIPDLSVTTRPIKSVGSGEGALMRGFQAQLSVTLTGVARQPAPQLWDVICYGDVPPDRNLVIRT